MKARQLIVGALQLICQAFDEAWTSIAANFGSDPSSIEDGRLELARAVLSVARDNRDSVWKV